MPRKPLARLGLWRKKDHEARSGYGLPYRYWRVPGRGVRQARDLQTRERRGALHRLLALIAHTARCFGDAPHGPRDIARSSYSMVLDYR